MEQLAEGVRHLGAGLREAALSAVPGEKLLGGGLKVAGNIAAGARLRSALRLEEAASVFTRSGGLHPDAVRNSTRIIDGVDLRNPAVIAELTRDGSNLADWGKYTTRWYQSPSGDFQVHYYRNRATGAVNTSIDYKAVFR